MIMISMHPYWYTSVIITLNMYRVAVIFIQSSNATSSYGRRLQSCRTCYSRVSIELKLIPDDLHEKDLTHHQYSKWYPKCACDPDWWRLQTDKQQTGGFASQQGGCRTVMTVRVDMGLFDIRFTGSSICAMRWQMRDEQWAYEGLTTLTNLQYCSC